MRLLGRCLENYCPTDVGELAMVRQLETSYPRPQLQRGNWLNLNGDWKFAYDDDGLWQQPNQVSEWSRTIVVPFTPESKRSGIHDTGFHANCWYERSFDLEPSQDSNRVLLHFGAVDYRARVWINHQFVGEHEGGHTPFSFDITSVLNPDGKQIVTVWAHDSTIWQSLEANKTGS